MRLHARLRSTASRDAALLVVAGLVAWLLLLGAVSVGLRLPLLRSLTGLGEGAPLSWSSRQAASFAPLDDTYVSGKLGLPTLVGPAASGSTSFGDPSRATPAGGAEARPVRHGPVSHPFTNDDFANARTVDSLPYAGRTDMSAATREPGEPADCAPAGGTAWYRYTPVQDIGLRADTLGTRNATSVGVFYGTSLADLHVVGCDTSVQGSSQVAFLARAGQTLYLQFTGPLQTGELFVNVAPVGETGVVSLYDSDEPGSGSLPSISVDGRYVAFQSGRGDLDPKHRADPGEHVYVRDRSAGTTEMVSLSTAGVPGDSASSVNSISADGRYVAFQSLASNLVEERALSSGWNVYVHDRVTGVTTLESVTSSGESASGGSSLHPRISAGGRYVLFDTSATNLRNAAEHCDYRGCFSAVLHDRLTGATKLAALTSGGTPAEGPSYAAAITPDGRSVLFSSPAANLPGANGFWQLYLHDRRTGVTHLVSAGADGTAGIGDTGNASPDPTAAEFPVTTAALSDDGRFVSFLSEAALVADDTNVVLDAFVRDTWAGTTTRVSVTSTGEQPTPDATAPSGTGLRSTSISADGRYVAFDSGSPDLVPGDTNLQPDVFVRDRLAGTTVRVSVSSSGAQRSERSFFPTLAGDGSVAVFVTDQGPVSGAKSIFAHVIPELVP